jgi:hypothetical protein
MQHSTAVNFAEQLSIIFSQWFKIIQAQFEMGHISLDTAAYSYSNHIEVAESPTHYIFEFNGSSDYQELLDKGLTVSKKVINVTSNSAYFYGPFQPKKENPEYGLSLSVGFLRYINGFYCTQYDYNVFKSKVNV